MPIKDLVADARQRMHASVETVRRELATMRTGRASLAMLDGIKVDYYGTPTPLNQVGNLATPDATLITIQAWDPKEREWRDEWDSNGASRNGQELIPPRVKLSLTIKDEQGKEKTYTTQARIFLGNPLDF